ncbi:hypothetical protein H8M03_01830 [Sphingomonas sabuli]|uniref:Aa3-type cytochrome c oxidase subunit IV n=1 Tax=Sphingomonas sabuli TaxID=2764186 RepID=A0A7G9L3C7_9SPHN|nr:hypothetical protein [Sphingomonas sabuli]QNM83126.1 hypothetical protein H8M03_01830 [Sphingomonas sabuli]
MAHEEEPFLTHPPTPEVARHVKDYTLMIAMLKWGAIISFVIAFLVMYIIT